MTALIPSHAIAALKRVRGVEAAFLDGSHLYAVAPEHDAVDQLALLAIEDTMQGIEVHVWAHQGRDPAERFPESLRVF